MRILTSWILLALSAIIMSCSNQNNTSNDSDSVKPIAAEPIAATDSVKTAKNNIIVVDFFATWCGPCRQLSPYFEKWANVYRDNAVFEKVDVDQEQMLADEYEIDALPTVIVFSEDSVELQRVIGFDPEGIEAAIQKAINTPIKSK